LFEDVEQATWLAYGFESHAKRSDGAVPVTRCRASKAASSYGKFGRRGAGMRERDQLIAMRQFFW